MRQLFPWQYKIANARLIVAAVLFDFSSSVLQTTTLCTQALLTAKKILAGMTPQPRSPAKIFFNHFIATLAPYVSPTAASVDARVRLWSYI